MLRMEGRVFGNASRKGAKGAKGEGKRELQAQREVQGEDSDGCGEAIEAE